MPLGLAKSSPSVQKEAPMSRARCRGKGVRELTDVMQILVKDELKSDDEDKDCLRVGECSDEAVKARVLPSPSPSSRQEVSEHDIHLAPFRTWCPHCVAGKAKADKHSASGGVASSETPVVSMDDTFTGDKKASGNE